jgi:hypothetical protein
MKSPVSRLVFLYPESSGIVSGFVNLYVVTWSEKKLVHNYTVLNFTQELRLVVVMKLFTNMVGGSGKL